MTALYISNILFFLEIITKSEIADLSKVLVKKLSFSFQHKLIINVQLFLYN